MGALVSVFPLLAMWMFGHGNTVVLSRVLKDISTLAGSDPSAWLGRIRMTLIAVQIALGLFLVNLVCINPQLHLLIVVLFIATLVAHLACVGLTFGVATEQGKAIKIIAWVGAVCLVLGFFFPDRPSQQGQYALFFGECIGLSCFNAIS